MKPRLEIFTDGSSKNRVGGWSFVIIADPENPIPVSGGKVDTTNNEMELTAILNAMAWLSLNGCPPATIWSDSQYALQCVTAWAPGWEKKGWTKKGGAIKNLELIKGMLSLYRDLPNVKLKWVRGHNGNPWNVMADKLAEKAREAQTASLAQSVLIPIALRDENSTAQTELAL